MVALYYKPYGGTTWQDVSQYIGNKGVISWSQELGVNLLEFKFSLEKPLDEALDPLIIEAGDDFIFCNDNTRSNVVGNCAGVVINNGKKIIAWDLKNDRPNLRYDITVRQRDFSKDIATFDYKTDTSLSTIVSAILDTHTNDLIGGYLAVSSQAIPKYELLCPDITISSFDFQGKALKALKQLLDSIGCYFRIQYFIEQNSTTTLNLVGKIVIFNASGAPAGGLWAEGLNNTTVKRGYIINPYFIDEDTTPDQPSILWGETLPSLETDFESAKNYFNFIALVQDGLNLTREDFTQTNLENFKLANKAKDILYVARLITDYVVSVSNTTTFTLPTGTSQKLLYDQQRLTDNNLGGLMVCKITSNGVEYIRVFTISGVTVTLASGITGLQANDTFELINSYDILEENKDSYPVDGYVIKHVRYDENGEVKFPKYDKPNPADTVVVHYYALSDYIKETYFQGSISKYGLFDFDLDIDYPLTTGQLDLIYNEFYKYVEPLKTIRFKSVRPQPLAAGDSLSVDITNLATGQFIVNSIDCKVIANKGYKNKYSMPSKKDNLLIEQTIEMASYRDSLTEILAGFKPALYNKTAIVDDKIDYRNLMQLEIIVQFNPGTATVSDLPSVPTGLNIDSWTDITAEISFNASTGATGYKLYVYNLDTSSYVSGYNGYDNGNNITSSITGLPEDTNLRVEVSAYNGSGESSKSSPETFKTKIEKILYISNHVTRNYYYTSKSDASSKTKLTSNTTYTEGNLDWWARVSPDGTKIVYSRGTATNTGALFIKSLIDGSEIPASPSGATNYWYPAWNPADLDHIYCWKNPNSTSSILVKINLATLVETVIYNPGTSFCYDLDFKDDGSECLVRVGATVFKLNTSTWASSGSFTGQMARYNHDETKILYIVSISGVNQIFDCNVNTTSQIQRTSDAGNKYNPIQQPKSPYDIVYYKNNSGDAEMWKMTASYTGNAVFIDESGNLTVPTDWGLVQY